MKGYNLQDQADTSADAVLALLHKHIHTISIYSVNLEFYDSNEPIHQF